MKGKIIKSSLTVYEDQIIRLKEERTKMIKKGYFKYADNLYARIYELELVIKSKKILFPV